MSRSSLRLALLGSSALLPLLAAPPVLAADAPPAPPVSTAPYAAPVVHTTFTASLYDDVNGDGVRESDEPLVPVAVSVSVQCGKYYTGGGFSGPTDGTVTASGDYDPGDMFSQGCQYEVQAHTDSRYYVTSGSGGDLQNGGNLAVHLDIPVVAEKISHPLGRVTVTGQLVVPAGHNHTAADDTTALDHEFFWLTPAPGAPSYCTATATEAAADGSFSFTEQIYDDCPMLIVPTSSYELKPDPTGYAPNPTDTPVTLSQDNPGGMTKAEVDVSLYDPQATTTPPPITSPPPPPSSPAPPAAPTGPVDPSTGTPTQPDPVVPQPPVVPVMRTLQGSYWSSPTGAVWQAGDGSAWGVGGVTVALVPSGCADTTTLATVTTATGYWSTQAAAACTYAVSFKPPTAQRVIYGQSVWQVPPSQDPWITEGVTSVAQAVPTPDLHTGTVWRDTNGNGVWDGAADPGVADLAVTLTPAAGQSGACATAPVVTTRTTASGFWSVATQACDYTVGYATPAGFLAVTRTSAPAGAGAGLHDVVHADNQYFDGIYGRLELGFSTT